MFGKNKGIQALELRCAMLEAQNKELSEQQEALRGGFTACADAIKELMEQADQDQTAIVTMLVELYKAVGMTMMPAKTEGGKESLN